MQVEFKAKKSKSGRNLFLEDKIYETIKNADRLSKSFFWFFLRTPKSIEEL